MLPTLALAQTPFTVTYQWGVYGSGAVCADPQDPSTTTAIAPTTLTCLGTTELFRANGTGCVATPTYAGFNSDGWSTSATKPVDINAASGVQWTISACYGVFSLNAISSALRRSNSGPQCAAFYYRINGAGAWMQWGTDICGITTNNTSPTLFNFTGTTINVPVGGFIDIKMVGWNATGAGGTLRLRDLMTINGEFNTAALAAPVVLPPSGITPTGFTANWNAVTDANLYVLDVSTDPAFGSFLPGYNGLDLGNVTSHTLSGLTNGCDYYYRVRASRQCGVAGVGTVLCGESGNSATQAASVTPPTAAVVTPSAVTQCGGTITLDATGGTGGTMHWQNTTPAGTSTATPSVQQVVSASGTYYFRAVSAAGCWGPEGSASVTIHPALTMTVTSQDEQCGDDGAINLTFNTGTPDYDVTLIDPLLNPVNIIATGASANFATLPDGTYQISVEDANGCTQSATVNLANNDPLASLAPTITNGNCGLNNGTIDPATATGGDGSYTYTLTGPSGPFSNTTAAAFTGLAAGTYTLTVADGLCPNVVFSNLVVNNGSAVASAAPLLTNGNCAQTNGTIDPATATGGDGTYTYTLTGPGGPFSNTTAAAFSGLATGTYSLTVSDGVCTDVVFSNLVIDNGLALATLPPTLTNGNCGLDNGTLDPATATGGDGTYTYTLSGPGGPFSNTNAAAFTGLASGIYTLTVSDGVCPDVTITNLLVSNGSAVASAAPTITNGSCGLINGIIEPAAATGGDGSYTYTLTGPGGPFSNTTGAPFTSLGTGTYTLTVDDGQCAVVTLSNVSLANGNPLASAAPTVTDGNCGLDNGTIDPADATGGDGSYTYTLDGPNGPFSNTTGGAFTGLATGTYTLTVSDGICTDLVFSNIAINNGFPIASAFPTITNGTCGALGSLLPAVATGGDGTYTYTLTGPGGPFSNTTGAVFSNLAGGTYTLTVSDGQCADVVLANQTVTVAPAITQISLTVTDENCDTDGTAILVLQDATGSVSYEMFNALNVSQGANATGEFTGVADGTYTITATDGVGCVFTTAPFTIDPGQPTVWNPAAFVLEAPTCNGGNDGNITVQATSLNPVSFNITPGGTFNNLTAGTYVVSAIGTCPTIDTTLVLTDPAAIVIGLQTGDPTCATGADGGIQATITSGGISPFNYELLDNTGTVVDANTNGAFNFLAAGNYTVRVTDDNTCTATQTTTLNDPAPVGLAVGNITDESCLNFADGRVELNITGGKPVYQFSMLAPDGTPLSNQVGIFFDLAAGVYTAVQVTDGCGNTATAANFIIDAGVDVSADFTASPNPVTVPDGVVSFSPTLPIMAGTNFTWQFGDGTPPVTDFAPQHTYTREGFYTVQLLATLGTCADTATAIVEVESAGIFIPTVFTPNGDGSNDDLTVIVPNGSTVRMLIFDRWGNEIESLSEPIWRPEASLPESVYVLHLEVTLPNGLRLSRASSVTLLR